MSPPALGPASAWGGGCRPRSRTWSVGWASLRPRGVATSALIVKALTTELRQSCQSSGGTQDQTHTVFKLFLSCSFTDMLLPMVRWSWEWSAMSSQYRHAFFFGVAQGLSKRQTLGWSKPSHKCDALLKTCLTNFYDDSVLGASNQFPVSILGGSIWALLSGKYCQPDLTGDRACSRIGKITCTVLCLHLQAQNCSALCFLVKHSFETSHTETHGNFEVNHS